MALRGKNSGLFRQAPAPLPKTEAYRPADCDQAICDYPQKVLPTGSGHDKDCPAHLRYAANGNTWRPESKDKPESPAILKAYSVEGLEILAELDGREEEFSPRDFDFLTDMLDRRDRFQSGLQVTELQLKWLRDLRDKARR